MFLEINLSEEGLSKVIAYLNARLTEIKGKSPSYALAISAGVEDRSYRTQRYGVVPDFSGEARIVMVDGSIWQAIGYGPQGDAECVTKDGWIEFVLIEREGKSMI